MDPLNITAQIEGMEWIVILIIIAVLVIFLPKIIERLPQSARNIGRARGEFARGKKEVERELEQEFGTKGGAK